MERRREEGREDRRRARGLEEYRERMRLEAQRQEREVQRLKEVQRAEQERMEQARKATAINHYQAYVCVGRAVAARRSCDKCSKLLCSNSHYYR
jgi:phage tail tape-measure protein